MCAWCFNFLVFRVIHTHLNPPGSISGSNKMRMVKFQLPVNYWAIATHTLFSLNWLSPNQIEMGGSESRASPASPNSDAQRWKPTSLKKHMSSKCAATVLSSHESLDLALGIQQNPREKGTRQFWWGVGGNMSREGSTDWLCLFHLCISLRSSCNWSPGCEQVGEYVPLPLSSLCWTVSLTFLPQLHSHGFGVRHALPTFCTSLSTSVRNWKRTDLSFCSKASLKITSFSC